MNTKTINTVDSTPLDPRRRAFISAYYEPDSSTYSNAYQSALEVGFSRSTAKDILYSRPKWLREKEGSENQDQRSRLLLRLEEIIDDPGITTRDKIKAIELMMKHYGMLAGHPTNAFQVNIQNILD